MLVAVGTFSLMDAGLKQLTAHYPTLEVSFLRGAASLPFVLLPVVLRRSWSELRPVRWKLHLLRGVLAVVMLAGFVYSVSLLSLADAYSIFLSTPLLITALSVPLLGEHVDWRRWLAICTGLAGVLVVLRPTGSGMLTLGGLAAFVAALCYALNVVTIRVLGRTETTVSTVFWFMVLLTLFSGLLSVLDWRAPRAADLPLIVWVGACGAAGQHLITVAFRNAPASVIAPLEYTALLWGVAIDWAVWNVLPDLRMLGGASIVIASGLYIIVRQSRSRPVAASIHDAAG
jgi:drug/metabolite transporter (DMT)-like permease